MGSLYFSQKNRKNRKVAPGLFNRELVEQVEMDSPRPPSKIRCLSRKNKFGETSIEVQNGSSRQSEVHQTKKEPPSYREACKFIAQRRMAQVQNESAPYIYRRNTSAHYVPQQNASTHYNVAQQNVSNSYMPQQDTSTNFVPQQNASALYNVPQQNASTHKPHQNASAPYNVPQQNTSSYYVPHQNASTHFEPHQNASALYNVSQENTSSYYVPHQNASTHFESHQIASTTNDIQQRSSPHYVPQQTTKEISANISTHFAPYQRNCDSPNPNNVSRSLSDPGPDLVARKVDAFMRANSFDGLEDFKKFVLNFFAKGSFTRNAERLFAALN